MSKRSSKQKSGMPTEKDLQSIITKENGAATLVAWADKIGLQLKNKRLSTNQIRAIFGEVRQIQGAWSISGHREQALRRLFLLKPKMAYRARKEGGEAVRMLVDVLIPALDLVTEAPPRPKDTIPGTGNNQDDNFQRFVDFFEAILAYLKAHGGK